jgi:hypothetical protein
LTRTRRRIVFSVEKLGGVLCIARTQINSSRDLRLIGSSLNAIYTGACFELRADRTGKSGVWPRFVGPEKDGGKVEHAFERANIVLFPPTAQRTSPRVNGTPATITNRYEFSEGELAVLCRWFSAMKYAFCGTEGVMIVSHLENYSAVGLYNRAGGAPNCLIAKHEARDGVRFFWSTEVDPPRPITSLSEIINAHIRAIRPPRNERNWLDPSGWMKVYAARLIARHMEVV